jgi:hypothetical protein
MIYKYLSDLQLNFTINFLHDGRSPNFFHQQTPNLCFNIVENFIVVKRHLTRL